MGKKNELLEAMIKVAEAQILGENDYLNSDGFIACTVCHTSKQTRLKEPNERYVVPVACKCKMDEYNAREEKKRLEVCEIVRNRYIEFEACRKYRFAQDDGRTAGITRSLQRYCEKFEEMLKKNLGLLLHGPVGTGKTFYAACIANELIDKGYAVVMSDLPSVVDYLHPFGKQQSKREEYEEHLKKCDLLILDDLSAERSTEHMRESIYRVINTRDGSDTPMIVTTNLTKQQMSVDTIEKRRVYDRIGEMCHPIEVGGESRRAIIAGERAAKVDQFLGLVE
jgi:DNA replication protein DnaC